MSHKCNIFIQVDVFLSYTAKDEEEGHRRETSEVTIHQPSLVCFGLSHTGADVHESSSDGEPRVHQLVGR